MKARSPKRKLRNALAATLVSLALMAAAFLVAGVALANPETWYLRATAGTACGVGDREALNQTVGSAVSTKALDGTGDTWNRAESPARDIAAGDWQVLFDATTDSGGGPPNRVTVLVQRRDSGCNVQQTIINEEITLSEGTAEYQTSNADPGEVSFADGDILTLTLTQTTGNQTVTVRYAGTAGGDADSRLTHPDEPAIPIGVTDLAGLADSVTSAVGAAVTDLAALSDSVTSAVGAAVTEGLTLSESIEESVTSAVDAAVTDLAALSDSVSSTVGAAVTDGLTLSESVQDSVTGAVDAAVMDGLTLSESVQDSVQNQFGFGVGDGSGLAESVVFLVQGPGGSPGGAVPAPAPDNDDDDDEADFSSIFGSGAVGGGGQPPALSQLPPTSGEVAAAFGVTDGELDTLQQVLARTLGETAQITGNTVLIVNEPGPEGGITVVLPVRGATVGPIVGDLNFTLGSLSIQTTAGQTTAIINLGGGLTVTGSRLVGTPEGGLQVLLEDPKLHYRPEPPDVSDLSGGSPDITEMGAEFTLDLKRLPAGVALDRTFTKEIAALVPDAEVQLEQLARNQGGEIGDLGEAVAFAVRIDKTSITNDDLGENRVALKVSADWYVDNIAQGKRLFLAKFDDDGSPIPPLQDVTDECEDRGNTVTCSALFAGVQGGLSTFALLSIAAPGPAKPATYMKPARDNLVRLWYFSDATGEWTFYDPRPVFLGTNNLSHLVAGQNYWVLVSQDQVLTLNGEIRSLTAGWNQIIW
ncbi:MAG: hypothetical protein ACE5Q6_06725 [Dehalococcoidia bacterium]